jgi:hypothetical protein
VTDESGERVSAADAEGRRRVEDAVVRGKHRSHDSPNAPLRRWMRDYSTKGAWDARTVTMNEVIGQDGSIVQDEERGEEVEHPVAPTEKD